MTSEVRIPAMGESITGGILAAWRVQDGETVRRDQPLFELETDKITSEGVADADGVIRLKVEAGAEVEVGQVVATIEPVAGATEPARGGSSDLSSPAPLAGAPPSEIEIPKSKIEDVAPSVRRLAEESGIDPRSVAGTGKGGRVTKGDMLQAIENKTPTPAAGVDHSQSALPTPESEIAPAAAPPPAAPRPADSPAPPPTAPAAAPQRRKMTPLRAKIAERLVQAKNQTAMLTTFNEVDMSAVRDLRARYQDDFTKKHGVKLGFMSFFVKAVVHALKEIPAVGAQIDGDFVVDMAAFDIGVAVSTDRGLIVPVLRACDTRSLARIETDVADFARRARDGRITLEDLEGGVFTITNGGIFGSLLSTPILNPPQSAILGMHAIQERPVAIGGQVVVRPMMYLALSYDHRIVDGREAVTFLVRVKQAIEDPARLLLAI